MTSHIYVKPTDLLDVSEFHARVDGVPGHIAAHLDVVRPAEMFQILKAFQTGRYALLLGPPNFPAGSVSRSGPSIAADPDPHGLLHRQACRESVYAITSLIVADARAEQIAAGCGDIGRSRTGCTGSRFRLRRGSQRDRMGFGTQVMAALRNTVTGILRLAGHANIAAALRHYIVTSAGRSNCSWHDETRL